MKMTALKSLAIGLVFAGCGIANASTIVGPSLGHADYGWGFVGISFTANVDSELTSFVFNSQGVKDTVVLSDKDGNVLHSISTSGGLSEVDWSLTAGSSYLLLQEAMNNATYVYYSGGTVTNNEITLTDTGLFGCTGNVYSNCSFKGTQIWGAFTNITTSVMEASNVPEPASLALLGLGLAGLRFSRRRKA